MFSSSNFLRNCCPECKEEYRIEKLKSKHVVNELHDNNLTPDGQIQVNYGYEINTSRINNFTSTFISNNIN